MIFWMCCSLCVSTVTVNTTFLKLSVTFVWSWSSLMTLAFSSARMRETLSSWPGLSGSWTAKQKTRPRAIRALSMSAEMVEMSMLPPEMIETTFLSWNGSFASAASERTPAPSATSLCF